MAFVIDQLRKALGVTPAVKLVYDKRIAVRVTVSLPANLPANSTSVASFTFDPRSGATTLYTVPKGYRIRLVDAYITATGDVPVNGELRLKKNLYTDAAVIGNVSTLLVSNPSRPTIAPVDWDEMEILTGEYINYAAVGTSAVTVSLTLVFDFYRYA